MKTISDFKRKMVIGAKLNSSLFFKDKDGKYVQQNALFNRECKIVQSNSFALTMETPEGIKNSWCNWPKKDEFVPIDENKVEIVWEGGKLIYEFL